ncbi:MAG: DUF4260 domain-containing protein [Pseudaminobacter sp.]
MRPLDIVVRLEWLAVFAAAVAFYAFAGGSWFLFLILFLAPDLSMAGYLAGPRAGAFAYNALHTVALPLCLLIFGIFADQILAAQLAAIWMAHIGFDRALGYGLKAASGFHDTHMGPIGRR